MILSRPFKAGVSDRSGSPSGSDGMKNELKFHRVADATQDVGFTPEPGLERPG
jgi:hypothetical protein